VPQSLAVWIPAIRLRHRPLRGVDSVHLRVLLTGTCRQRGSWSVAGHSHGEDDWVGRHSCRLARHGPCTVSGTMNNCRLSEVGRRVETTARLADEAGPRCARHLSGVSLLALPRIASGRRASQSVGRSVVRLKASSHRHARHDDTDRTVSSCDCYYRLSLTKNMRGLWGWIRLIAGMGGYGYETVRGWVETGLKSHPRAHL